MRLSKPALLYIVFTLGLMLALLAAPPILEYRGTDAATVAAVKDAKFYLLGVLLVATSGSGS